MVDSSKLDIANDRLRQVWQELCRSPGIASPRQAAMWNELVAEAWRHYHTLTHVEALVATLLQYEESLQSPAQVLMAAFFHDAVYDPRATDNEAQSADLATSFLMETEIEEAFVTSVRDLILATSGHMNEVATSDAAWFLDADLQILGASADDYDEYAAAIRREYDFVPEADYRAGRSAILQSFLNAPRIFRTSAMREKLEDCARINLARELANLAKE